MKLSKNIILAGLVVLIFATSLSAASQELSVQGAKNLRSGNMHLSGKRFDKALAFYEEVLAENPNNIEALQNIAAIYYDDKMKYDVAYDYYTKVIAEIKALLEEYEALKEADPKAAKKFYKKNIKKNKYDKNLENIEKLQRSCWIKLFNKGQEYFKQEAYDEALANYENLLVMAPDSIKTHKMIAMIYTKQGNTDKAIETYKKIAEMDPQDMAPIQQVAALLFGAEKYTEAAEWYVKATELEPENSDYYYNVAVCYNKAENNEKAFEYYTKTVEVDPEHLDAILNASNTAASLKDSENQIKYLKKYIEIDNENLDFIKYLVSLLIANKNYEDAAEYSAKWLELEPGSTEAKQIKAFAEQQNK